MTQALGYTKLFNAIGDAIEKRPDGAYAISVKKFEESIGGEVYSQAYVDTIHAEHAKELRDVTVKLDRIAREISEKIDPLCKALKPLQDIANAYDANELDDEARKFWGSNLEHANDRTPASIELYSGRGGRSLLTLAHALEARKALLDYVRYVRS